MPSFENQEYKVILVYVYLYRGMKTHDYYTIKDSYVERVL